MSNERPIRMLLLADSQTRAVTLNAGLAGASSPRFEVRRVTSLAQALAAVAGEHFDVVMLDLGPSAAVGLDRVAALRNAALASTIVVLADSAPEAHVVQALRSGADDCLLARRGGRPGELALRIRYAITRRALVGQNAADLLTPEVRARVRTEDELLLASGQASTNEVSVPTDDGSTRELQVVTFPVRTRTAP